MLVGDARDFAPRARPHHRIDLSPAEKMKGVTAVRAIMKAGDEVQWAGTELPRRRGQ